MYLEQVGVGQMHPSMWVWAGLERVGPLVPATLTPSCREPSQKNPTETASESTRPELDVEATYEESATLAEPGPQPCLHISIAGSGLEMAPGPTEGDPRPELVPFDSDSDDESSPSPSGTLQSQASRSTISSSFGSKCQHGELSEEGVDEQTDGEEGPQRHRLKNRHRAIPHSKVGSAKQ